MRERNLLITDCYIDGAAIFWFAFWISGGAPPPPAITGCYAALGGMVAEAEGFKRCRFEPEGRFV